MKIIEEYPKDKIWRTHNYVTLSNKPFISVDTYTILQFSINQVTELPSYQVIEYFIL